MSQIAFLWVTITASNEGLHVRELLWRQFVVWDVEKYRSAIHAII